MRAPSRPCVRFRHLDDVPTVASSSCICTIRSNSDHAGDGKVPPILAILIASYTDHEAHTQNTSRHHQNIIQETTTGNKTLHDQRICRWLFNRSAAHLGFWNIFRVVVWSFSFWKLNHYSDDFV